MMIDGSGRAGFAAVFGRDGDQRVIASVYGRNRDAAAGARVPPEGVALVADDIREARFIAAREKLGLAARGARAGEIGDVGRGLRKGRGGKNGCEEEGGEKRAHG